MKTNRILTTIIAMMLLTSCTSANTAPVVSAETSTATVTTTEELFETTKTIATTVPNGDTVDTIVDIVTDETVYSEKVQEWARNFARVVYAELENNKTTDTPTVLTPISITHEISAFDMDAMSADIFFLDTDFDGVPELFAGGHGTMGSGRYSVYGADGTMYGNAFFTWSIEDFYIDGMTLYAPSGSNSTPGYTKLTQGLPQIHANGFAFIDGTNTDVKIDLGNNSVTDVSVTTNAEYEALYSQYLGVNYADLQLIDTSSTPYVRDYLRVPDPANYTEEDIYNCLVSLLDEYVAQTAQ